MIKSMTGFGRCEVTEGNRKYTVEMKSVNHRYLDVNIKMPKALNFFESTIRNLLKEYMERGKVDLYITFEDFSEDNFCLKYNEELDRDGVIYLHSAQEGRSISILERNPRVCITFSTDHDLVFQHPEVACSYRMRSKSVICWGEVRFEEDFDKKTEALDIIMKQYSDKEFRYSDPAVKNVKIWIVEMDEVTCKEFGAPHNKLKIGS